MARWLDRGDDLIQPVLARSGAAISETTLTITNGGLSGMLGGASAGWCGAPYGSSRAAPPGQR